MTVTPPPSQARKLYILYTYFPKTKTSFESFRVISQFHAVTESRCPESLGVPGAKIIITPDDSHESQGLHPPPGAAAAAARRDACTSTTE